MICSKCGKYEVTYRHECKVCGYKKRNKDKISKIISENLWNLDEIEIIVYHILYNTYETINPILNHLRGRSLDDLMNVLSLLKIGGQTPIKVNIKCALCGNDIINPLKMAMRERSYCSMECRNKYKSENFIGTNSPSYKKIKTVCSNCKNEIHVAPWKYNQKNSYGESHCFCSQVCYWRFRSRYYAGEKSSNYGIKFSKEARDKMRKASIRRLSEGTIPQTNTKPHRKTNSILDDMGIKYVNEYNLKYHSLDIYLTDFNLGIEIMGDYWHGSPLKYKRDQLSSIQQKSIKQDKSKHTYTKKYHGFEILYLWEKDINENEDLCKKLISTYIKNRNELNDFNSFNYYVNGSEVLLKSEVLKPYFIE